MSAPPARSPQLPLLEREAELAEIDAALELAIAGEGQLVVIEGPAGIGKSRLVAAARERAAEAGLRVLSARGGELERAYGLGIVRQLFELPLATVGEDERAALLEGAAGLAARALSRGDDSPPARESAEGAGDGGFALLHGLYWLVANLSLREPLLLTIDDGHWADGSSLRFLAYLVRRLEELPVLVVLSARPDEPAADPALATLMADPAARVAHPARLTPDAVGRMLATELGREVEPGFASACATMTGGNPFLLQALVGAVRDDGVAPTASNAESIPELRADAVSRWILRRIGRLPDHALVLARSAAVLGDGGDLRVAAELAGLDMATAAEAADGLTSVGVLDRERAIAFAHPLVRSAVYADIPAHERELAHARAAAALAAGRAGPEVVSSHLLLGAPAGETWVVDTLADAARTALARGAATAAVRLLRRALEESPDSAARARVLHALGSAELLAGQSEAAVDHLDQYLFMVEEPGERARATSELAFARAAIGDEPGAVAALDEAIDAVADDRELALTLEGERAGIGLLNRATAPATAERLERHRDLGGETPGERLILASLAQRSWAVATSAAETSRLARAALADGALLAETSPDSLTYFQAIYALLLADDLEPAERELERAITAARACGSMFGFTAASSLRALLAVRRGDLSTAESDARAALDAERHGALTPMALTYLLIALLSAGRIEDAQRELAAVDLPEVLPNAMQFFPLQYARGLLRLMVGEQDAGFADVLAAGAREREWGIENPSASWRLGAALGHARTGDVERAVQLVDEQLALSRRWGTPATIGVALRARALLAGGGARSIALLRESAGELERSPSRLELARTLVDLGAALRRDGDAEEARDLLRRALDLAQSCSAPAVVERAHRQLKAAGGRPRRLVFSGAEALTASERRVATMAAEGMGNREIAQALFVTAKTVENHLGRVYRKLEIRSRAELPDALGSA